MASLRRKNRKLQIKPDAYCVGETVTKERAAKLGGIVERLLAYPTLLGGHRFQSHDADGARGSRVRVRKAPCLKGARGRTGRSQDTNSEGRWPALRFLSVPKIVVDSLFARSKLRLGASSH
jgi:hypothetical protein